MNKEYTISTITNNAVYTNICSFFSACNHTPIYTANNITVYRDETLSFYIIVYAISDEYVYFSFSTIDMEKMLKYGKMVVIGRSGIKWEMPKIPISV